MLRHATRLTLTVATLTPVGMCIDTTLYHPAQTTIRKQELLAQIYDAKANEVRSLSTGLYPYVRDVESRLKKFSGDKPIPDAWARCKYNLSLIHI